MRGRRARPRLPLRPASTSGRSSRAIAAAAGDPDRARDRSGEHLQARHPLLGAARRDLPRRVGLRAARLDGLLRHRPGAHRGRGRRAVRRREGHLLAARDRAVGRRARVPRQAGTPEREAGRSSTRSSVPPVSTSSTTTATRAPGRSSPTRSCSGCPAAPLGRRSLESGELEVQGAAREEGPSYGGIPLEGAAEAVADLGVGEIVILAGGPRRRSRSRRPASPSAASAALDRSGPPPPATLPDAPWHVWQDLPLRIGLRRPRAHMHSCSA